MSAALEDFSRSTRLKKVYDGANGKKISVQHHGRRYMLKFPSTPVRNQDVHYSASCFSEYLGSHIFEALGIPAQKTILGTYPKEGEADSLVVACEDFVADSGRQLVTFLAEKNSVFQTTCGGRGTELSDVLIALNGQENIDPVALRRFFWDMFVVDAFIANWDRHNGNWGFLYDARNDTLELAPVYDCGSSLYPGLPEEDIPRVLGDPKEIDIRIFERLT